MHQLLRRGYSLKLFPLLLDRTTQTFDIYADYTASKKDKNSKTLQLAVSDEHLLVDGMQLQVNHYYRPGKNFPTIDSLLLLHPPNELPVLLMFRITRSRVKHDLKLSGLERVNQMVLPSGTRKYYVVVSPVGIEPEIHVLKGRIGNVKVYNHLVDEGAMFKPEA